MGEKHRASAALPELGFDPVGTYLALDWRDGRRKIRKGSIKQSAWLSVCRQQLFDIAAKRCVVPARVIEESSACVPGAIACGIEHTAQPLIALGRHLDAGPHRSQLSSRWSQALAARQSR